MERSQQGQDLQYTFCKTPLFSIIDRFADIECPDWMISSSLNVVLWISLLAAIGTGDLAQQGLVMAEICFSIDKQASCTTPRLRTWSARMDVVLESLRLKSSGRRGRCVWWKMIYSTCPRCSSGSCPSSNRQYPPCSPRLAVPLHSNWQLIWRLGTPVYHLQICDGLRPCLWTIVAYQPLSRLACL